MCTVVVRWSTGPVQVLALRDELTSREFDDPDRWWPELPDVLGGRDRTAGGTWCASRVATGSTALVLNRPHKRVAEAGAPSRGVLPLLAVRHDLEWPSHVDVTGMASFALVLATPQRLAAWDFDGHDLAFSDLGPGTHMFTSGGAEDGKAVRYLTAFQEASYPQGWRDVLLGTSPHDDPAALVVRHTVGELVFATVFGQLIEAEPGRLYLEHSRQPWRAGTWVTMTATAPLAK